jgi:hypothetical protein
MLRADEKYFPGRHYVALPFSITHLIVYPYWAVVRASNVRVGVPAGKPPLRFRIGAGPPI